ncbi:MAG: hypothetical protein A4E26_00024 [Methanobacterium sp. PtaU1.Bin097]|jgi:hypothetical protein|nr:MAG: hypothetical protein A4E26_00024 [Methanobacterium sp. PtaU1.Bin097]
MLELVLAIAILILVIIIYMMYCDMLSKNYLIKSLSETNNQLFEELIKYKEE